MWVEDAQLGPDERTVVEKFANMTTGRRAAGGKLTVTDQRVVFRPNMVDKAVDNPVLDLPRAQVQHVDLAPRGGNGILSLFDGSMRRRLRITDQTGTQHLFVVNGAQKVLTTLQENGFPAA